MKKLITCLFIAALAVTVSADLIITEVVDGTLAGGLPKAVEWSNTGSTSINLSDYKFARYSNTATAPSMAILTGTMAPKSVITFTYLGASNEQAFNDVWGFNADIPLSICNGNGNDEYAILDASDDSVIDIFGVIGSSSSWYQDSYGKRTNAQLTASSTYDAAEWYLPGNDVLDGMDASQIAAAIPGMGVYEQVPEPAVFGLIALTLLFFRKK